MDARPDDASSHAAPVTTAIEPSRMREILAFLGDEFCRPLETLRSGFDHLLSSPNAHSSTEQLRQVQTMIGLCDGLVNLTRDFLDYTSMTFAPLPLAQRRTQLGGLVRVLDQRFAPRAAELRIDWDCALDGEDVSVTTDPDRCLQIAGHLVENALRATPEGGLVRVIVRGDGPIWHLCVSDTGPGIPDHVLEAFHQPIDPGNLPKQPDSGLEIPRNGLGLILCRALARRLGGRILLDSDSTRGTCVSVSLPSKTLDRAPVSSSKTALSAPD